MVTTITHVHHIVYASHCHIHPRSAHRVIPVLDLLWQPMSVITLMQQRLSFQLTQSPPNTPLFYLCRQHHSGIFPSHTAWLCFRSIIISAAATYIRVEYTLEQWDFQYLGTCDTRRALDDRLRIGKTFGDQLQCCLHQHDAGAVQRIVRADALCTGLNFESSIINNFSTAIRAIADSIDFNTGVA